MIVDLATGADRPPPDCDVLIVGAGTCGLLLADALRQRQMRVVVLESGALATTAEGQALNAAEQVGRRHYRGATEGRARVLGGTSSLWGGALLPFQAHDLGPRPHLDLPGWPLAHAELAAWVPALEAAFSLPGGSYGSDWLDEVVRRRDGIVDDEICETRYAKWPAFARRNTARLFDRQLRQNHNLVVCLNATTDALVTVDHENLTVCGAVCIGPDGRRHRVSARRVILCAGAIESTRLLLAGARDELAPALKASRWLGRGFHDHLSMHVAELHPPDPTALNRLAGFRFDGSAMRSHRFELTAQAQRQWRMPSAWAHIGFEGTRPGGFDALRRIMQSLQRRRAPAFSDVGALLADAPYLAQVVGWRLWRRQLRWPRDARYLVTVVGEQLPRLDNAISLSEQRNALGQRLPRIDWSTDDRDLETLRQAAQQLGDYWARHAPPACGPMHWLVPLDRPFSAQQLELSDIYHPGGTTRMSLHPSDGVVDADLAVHGARGLHVLSTSVFPTGASANPTMTLLLLALRLADHLDRSLARGH